MSHLFPDMPCMKRVYKDNKASVHWSAARKKSASRSAVKPLVNRSLCSFVGLHRISLVRASGLCFWRVVQETCLRCLGRYEGRLSPGRTVLSASRPARPRPATPPCAATRPARGMSRFWTRQVDSLIARKRKMSPASSRRSGPTPTTSVPSAPPRRASTRRP